MEDERTPKRDEWPPDVLRTSASSHPPRRGLFLSTSSYSLFTDSRECCYVMLLSLFLLGYKSIAFFLFFLRGVVLSLYPVHISKKKIIIIKKLMTPHVGRGWVVRDSQPLWLPLPRERKRAWDRLESSQPPYRSTINFPW
jgi:hypothetical protein